MISLVIEASTYAGSVALLNGSRVVAERTLAMRGKDEEALMPAVAGVLADAGIEVSQVGRIICGAGPGAFTSLRIAAGIAKGLALALEIPLVPVSSLALLVASQPTLTAGRYLAVLDAMRGEHYAQTFEIAGDGQIVADGPQLLVPTPQLDTLARERNAAAIGPAHQSVSPHARGAAHITNIIDAAHAADLAAWEPIYGRNAEAQVKWEKEHGRPLVGG